MAPVSMQYILKLIYDHKSVGNKNKKIGYKGYVPRVFFKNDLGNCNLIWNHSESYNVYYPVDNFGTVAGENPTPCGSLALWPVNGLSIVYWVVSQLNLFNIQ